MIKNENILIQLNMNIEDSNWDEIKEIIENS